MKGPLLKYAEARSFGKEVSLLSLSEDSTGKMPQTPKTQHPENGSLVSTYKLFYDKHNPISYAPRVNLPSWILPSTEATELRRKCRRSQSHLVIEYRLLKNPNKGPQQL